MGGSISDVLWIFLVLALATAVRASFGDEILPVQKFPSAVVPSSTLGCVFILFYNEIKYNCKQNEQGMGPGKFISTPTPENSGNNVGGRHA
jgi:hypothetical protein